MESVVINGKIRSFANHLTKEASREHMSLFSIFRESTITAMHRTACLFSFASLKTFVYVRFEDTRALQCS